MKRNLLIGIMTALMLSVAALTANAQNNLKKKVIFPAGKSSIILSGRISDIRTQQIYTIRARKGQVLSVLLTSKKRLTTFDIFNSHENESIGQPLGETQEWENTMPATDDYSIIVTINDSDQTDDYVLKIKIK